MQILNVFNPKTTRCSHKFASFAADKRLQNV